MGTICCNWKNLLYAPTQWVSNFIFIRPSLMFENYFASQRISRFIEALYNLSQKKLSFYPKKALKKDLLLYAKVVYSHPKLNRSIYMKIAIGTYSKCE